MERFIYNANIEHYRRLIAESENDAGTIALKDPPSLRRAATAAAGLINDLGENFRRFHLCLLLANWMI